MHNKNRLKPALIALIIQLLIVVNPVLAATVAIQLSVNLPDEAKQNIIENLSLYQYRDSPLLDENNLGGLTVKGVSEIQTMLQTFGYFKAKISASTQKTNGNFNVVYTVDLGSPMIVDRVDIQINGAGKSDREVTKWVKSYPIVSGDILVQNKYEEAKKTLLQLLRDRGYFSSKLQTHKIGVNLDTLKANIDFSVDTGPRYYFGETYYIQEFWDLGFLNRFLPYHKGELFDAALVAELHKRLLQSQEFFSVEINPEIANAGEDLQVPITVRLTPRKKWRFSVGLGYGTDTGIQASGSVNQRRFTRRAHQTGADTTLAEKKQEVAVHYTIPAKDPWSDYYNFSYGFTHEATDDTERYTNSLGSKAVYEFDVLRNIVSLSFEDEQFLIGTDSKSRSKLLVPSFAMQYKPLEDSYLKKLKFDLYGEIRGASEKLVSDVSFTQLITRGNLRYKLSSRLTALSRFDIGFTDIADFNSLPVSYRFFAGGDNSVRGYDYNTLSPVDENGNYAGGRNLLVGSMEFQYRFLKHWDTAVFYDIGNAYNVGNTDLKQGAGIGFGWLYSVISVRVYAANALDISSRPWKIHVLIGANL